MMLPASHAAPLRIAVLGSTGSIGRQTLDVAARFPERIAVVALSAGANDELLVSQAKQFGARICALADSDAAARATGELSGTPVGIGPEAIRELARLDDVDLVVNALVGAAGLRASVAALESGKRLALANKESLVVGGRFVTDIATTDTLIPVDSEHSALFQCLLGESSLEVKKLWLTASGGPFLGCSADQLRLVSVEETLKHPRWTMGPKITVDSATLMNKGLEVIEAHHLFGLDYDDITVVIHPQSTIHSMVEFTDGSVKAHLGVTDMRIPIQYALSYPARWEAPLAPLDFRTLESLTFRAPDTDAFRCLALAYEAGTSGGSAPIVLNAANEIAVEAFLARRCGFTHIAEVVELALSAVEHRTPESLDEVEVIDAEARRVARSLLESRTR